MNLLDEIQNDALSHQVPMSTILRKTYVLARRLKDSTLLKWIEGELNGYDWERMSDDERASFPSYRRPIGVLKALGLGGHKPVLLKNPKLHDAVCLPPIVLSIPHIEAEVKDGDGSTVSMQLPPNGQQILAKVVGDSCIFYIEYTRATFVNIMEVVRNKLLQLVIDIGQKFPAIETSGTLTPRDRRELASTVVKAIYPWDLFVVHADEDKQEIAAPLATALTKEGLKVWYDDFSLKMGDSLRRSIDRGLSEAGAGLVILSPHFFRKEWPQKELDGLVALQRKILPVWHGVGKAEIARYSPTLADIVGRASSSGIPYLVQEIRRVLPVGDRTQS